MQCFDSTVREHRIFIKIQIFLKKGVDKITVRCYNTICRTKRRTLAGVAQWQSSWFVISRLLVRLRSPAPVALLHRSSIGYGGIPERPKGADCKSVVTDFGGPNPPSPTIKRVRKRCIPQKARFYRAFLLPKGRFSELQNRRCKIGFFPLRIDTNSSNNRIQNKNGR